MTTEAQIAWAAGLFEGEGCVSFKQKAQAPLLSLAMTDRDVVDRFHEIVGVGTRHEKHHTKPGQEHFQTQYGWYCAAIVDVRRVIALFLPYFGDRRRKRAMEVLDAYNTAPVRRKFKDRCPEGHMYDEDNLRIYGGKKKCRECNRQRAEAHRKALV
jgi:hypothetical protein